MTKFHLRPIVTTLCLLLACYELGAREWSKNQQSPNTTSSDIQLRRNVWRDLVPLHSTRVDVERMFGSSKMSHGFNYIYQGDNERVDVLYSAGPCKLSGVERWNVPVDTVIKVMVTPKMTLLVRDLRPDAGKYSRTQDVHPENWVHYWNLEDGITIDALLNDGCEEVISVTYQPSREDRNSALACG